MPSPFPGMNPYLEESGVWQSIHKRLIVAIADALNPQLRPHYRVEIEERVYEASDESLLVDIPDNVVIQRKQTSEPLPSSFAIAATIEPVVVTLPMPETIREWFLQVRHVATGRVITVIEILSPKNKRQGEGRLQYLEKRQQILASATHLVEIDLLRRDLPLPMETSLKSDYRILVSRSEKRPQAELYGFNVPDAIPVFALPLRVATPSGTDSAVAIEPSLDLQPLLHEAYDRGSYDLVIDYSRDPVPALVEPAATWAKNWLREQGLR